MKRLLNSISEQMSLSNDGINSTTKEKKLIEFNTERNIKDFSISNRVS
jgi:hypothetical protein